MIYLSTELRRMNRDVKNYGVVMGLYRVVSNQSVETHLDDGLNVGQRIAQDNGGSFQGFEGIRVTLNPGKPLPLNFFLGCSIQGVLIV